MSTKQTALVLQHIAKHGYITQLVATNYGIPRLASRVFDINVERKRTGLAPLATQTMRDLAGKRYTRYSIAA